ARQMSGLLWSCPDFSRSQAPPRRQPRGVGSNQVPMLAPPSASFTRLVDVTSTPAPASAASRAADTLVAAPPVPTPAAPMSPKVTPVSGSPAGTVDIGSAPGSDGGRV